MQSSTRKHGDKKYSERDGQLQLADNLIGLNTFPGKPYSIQQGLILLLAMPKNKIHYNNSVWLGSIITKYRCI